MAFAPSVPDARSIAAHADARALETFR